MKTSDIDLRKMLEFNPAEGKVTFGADRILLMRQDSFASLRKLLVEQLGESLARAILTQFGYRCGYGDFSTLTKSMNFESDMDRLAAGPMLHSWEGIVRADPTFLEFDRERGQFHMMGTWKNSYEVEIHLAEFGRSAEPVCHSAVGYASGWCSAFFGKKLLAVETRCVGRGDDICTFEIRPPEKWGPEAAPFQRALDATEYSLSRELADKLATIEKQAAAIRELSTPVLEVWDDILVLPIVGVVDTRRSMEIMNTLLESIVRSQSRCVIVDITGVEVVDTKTADYLLKVVNAAGLLGARCVLTGLSPAVAQTLVEIGAELGGVRTLRNLKEGLKDCLRFLKSEG